ncbi:DUF4383 domain-containing protein [Nocardioides silvaticus]|uniref:DUF4383 domain-containing protein n=1 Tax=Nocardioides silvaticus TaxID=2201891 RepID=A0A316TIX6_9ACTN|nr:DUF4383 domain-containing protein [Nocardioides silvaticus]PWN03005.1 DUF4383 domain-containing protein [Nocardioides silvaticus]
MAHDTQVASSTLLQKAALAVAATFALVGVLGFIPGITTNYDQMEFIGHHSGAELLGIFAVSVLHNLVHLAFGIVGFVLAKSFDGARAYLIGGGIIYLVLTVYGLVVDRHDDANFVPLNAADNWLHLVLGIGMIALGLLLGNRSEHRNVGRAV